MRITCSIDINNRLLPSFNMQNQNKSYRCQLAIGRKSEAGVWLTVISNKKTAFDSFKLEGGNMQQIFAKFIEEGKATIRFLQPPCDLCISQADVVHLKSFISVIKAVASGKSTDAMLSSSAVLSSNKISEKLKTKLTINNRKDYPVTSGFPPHLESLFVMSCGLKRFDSRMLALRRLTVLDLSNNQISLLPDNFDGVPQLANLKLSNNLITEVPASFCSSHLKISLSQIDLSSNQLSEIPPYFYNLENLITLKLDNNKLSSLSYGLRKLKRLRSLTLSHNQLHAVPAEIIFLHLNSLDVFGNSLLFTATVNSLDSLVLPLPTLFEFSFRILKKHGLRCDQTTVGNLAASLSDVSRCLCGTPCLYPTNKYKSSVRLRCLASSVISSNDGPTARINVEGALCSYACRKLLFSV